MRKANKNTVAISIGVGRDGTSIVLPRDHELVKHLEALIVPAPPKPTHSNSNYSNYSNYSNNSNDPLAALASLSRYATTSTTPTQALPAFPRHLLLDSPSSSVGSVHPHTRPGSPYLSDSSSSSTLSSRSSHSSTTPTTSSSVLSNKTSGSRGCGVRRPRSETGATATTSSHGASKKCQFEECNKIAVSRGVCRGHGGGRRCQHEGCSKGAQSRSDFCWGHGGGQRCEVANCMRSRKTKRFCVAHLNWENATDDHTTTGMTRPGDMPGRSMAGQRMLMPRVSAPMVVHAPPSMPQLVHYSQAKLPSLQEALQKHHCASSVPVPQQSSRQPFTGYVPIVNC